MSDNALQLIIVDKGTRIDAQGFGKSLELVRKKRRLAADAPANPVFALREFPG